ncbi:unnamed protein product [Rotaria sp. Silwood1]|nr:unnamed protein product [Rotaria sp. Silwood1]CAF3659725.1 unnamed protein product [Rotaria sp. Silwood1]
MGENGTYKALGEIHALNENIATINMSTYLNYGKPCDVCFYEYIDNIIPLINHKKIFTSGYDVREMEDDEPVVKPKNVLKCSHGGIIDTTDNISTRGGINKDVRTNIYLPSRYRQETAANAAIELTYLFLKKLWHLTETNHNSTSYFGRLLESV